VIGWLSSLSPEGGKPNLAAFRKALAETGYVEGQKVQIEYRWADGNYDRRPLSSRVRLSPFLRSFASQQLGALHPMLVGALKSS